MKNSQSEKRREKEKDKDKFKEPTKPEIQELPYNFNISNIIVKYIIEKLISFTITKSLRNKINKKIPSFCFEEIKNSLELAMYIDFIYYDKDDLTLKKKTLLDYKSKSSKNISKKNEILSRNKSEILRKYKLNKELDAYTPYEDSINLEVLKTPKKEKEQEDDKLKNNFFTKFAQNRIKDEIKEIIPKDPNKGKILDGLIIRKSFNNSEESEKSDNYSSNLMEKNSDKKNKKNDDVPFEVKDIDEIEKIKNFDSHKLDFNPKFFNMNEENIIAYDIIKTNKNSWINIEQPGVPPIDRDAGTKINYIKSNIKIKKMKSEVNPMEELKKLDDKKKDNTSSSKDQKSTSLFSRQKSKFLNFSFKNLNSEENPRKKKYTPIPDFPSEDIDPKTLGFDTESEELKKLRENLEKELIEKKIEHNRKLQKEREIQALEKAREEKRKELANKNVTVDIKGDIIYIKSLNINDFINDFTKMRSKLKEIKTIQTASKNVLMKKALVEKNPINYYFEQIDKEKPKKKGKKNLYFNHKSAKGDERNYNNTNKNNLGIMDRLREPIYASGSNFEILNPECGVNLKENEKTKSGGKDFYRKYNKYSIEVFEETLNRTVSSNFYSGQKNSIFSDNINSGINNINRSLNKLKTKSNNKDDINKNINEKNINNAIKNKGNNNPLNLIIPTGHNNKLLVKATNLKMALNNLDLITESDERYYSEKKNRQKSQNNNINIIKKNKKIFLKTEKSIKKFDEINKFAKTLVGSDKWGDDLFQKKKIDIYFKQPQKPQKDELKRELPSQLLQHLPRKRLPPINLNNRMNNDYMIHTMTEGFFGRKKKLKILLSEENKNKMNDTNKKTENYDNKGGYDFKGDKNDENIKKDEFSYTTTSGFFKNN